MCGIALAKNVDDLSGLSCYSKAKNGVDGLTGKPGEGGDSALETGAVAKACQILLLLEQRNTALGLTDVARLTGINKATAYRILRSLVARIWQRRH